MNKKYIVELTDGLTKVLNNLPKGTIVELDYSWPSNKINFPFETKNYHGRIGIIVKCCGYFHYDILIGADIQTIHAQRIVGHELHKARYKKYQ